MTEVFHSGRFVDAILVFMGIEWMVLILVRINGKRVVPPLDLLVTMGAGAALLMALRAALTASAWPSVALWLTMALVFHGGDLALRWSKRRT